MDVCTINTDVSKVVFHSLFNSKYSVCAMIVNWEATSDETNDAGKLKGSIIVLLTSCLTGLESAV